MEIKKLLHEERMTIEGAKIKLKQTLSQNEKKDMEFVRELKIELQEIMELLT